MQQTFPYDERQFSRDVHDTHKYESLPPLESLQEETCVGRFAIVIFTFYRDRSYVMRAIKAIRRLYPSVPIYVVDDLNLPLPRKVVNVLKRFNCIYTPTPWKRNGNLRGWEVAREITDTFLWVARSAKLPEDGVVVKVDSDALWLRRGWLEAFIDTDIPLGGLASKMRVGICGPTYGVRVNILPKIAATYRRDIPCPYATEEDYEIVNRVARVTTEPRNELYFQIPYSFIGVCPYYGEEKAGQIFWNQFSPVVVEHILNNWDICVFGQPVPINVPPNATLEQKAKLDLLARRKTGSVMGKLYKEAVLKDLERTASKPAMEAINATCNLH